MTKLTILILTLALCATPDKRMASLTIQPGPSDGVDTHIDALNPTTADGNNTSINVGPFALGSTYHGLLRFNLSEIASTAQIDSAAMTLRFNSLGAAGPVYIFRVTQGAWTEGATYNKYDGTTNWIIAGGDYNAALAAVMVVPSSVPNDAVVNGADFLAVVRDAILNHAGILDLVFISALGANGAFYSCEWTTASERPKIVVNYSTSTNILTVDTTADPPGAASTIIQSDPFPLSPSQTILINKAF